MSKITFASLALIAGLSMTSFANASIVHDGCGMYKGNWSFAPASTNCHTIDIGSHGAGMSTGGMTTPQSTESSTTPTPPTVTVHEVNAIPS